MEIKSKNEIKDLDNIISKQNALAGEKRPDIIDQVIVKYDSKLGKAETLQEKRPSWSNLFGLFKSNSNADYYLIDTDAKVSFKLQYEVSTPEYGLLVFNIAFTISAIPNAETKLVETLARRKTPTTILQEKLSVWIEGLIASQVTNVFQRFDSFAATLKSTLIQQGSAIGLKFDLKVSGAEEDQPLPGSFSTDWLDVPVQPKDYNDLMKLQINVTMAPDPAAPATLVKLGYKKKDTFNSLLKQWLQAFVRESYSYNDLNANLHSRFRNSLMAYWNEQFSKQNLGWTAVELVLKSLEVLPAEFKFEKMEIEVDLRNVRVPLRNTVILNLENAEKFKNRRITDLERWIREKLQQIAQNMLSHVSYAELVSNINVYGDSIKSDLNAVAREIGYKVEYLLTAELVDHARLNFNFQFDKNEQAYQTSLNENVRLNVLISGKISSLNHPTWKSTLTPDTDFAKEMKKVLIPEVRKELLNTQADDFYTRFTDKVGPALEARIRAKLVSEFNVDPEVDILPQMEESDIIDLINQLQTGLQEVPVDCFNGAANYKVTFSVTAVDPLKWSLFANRNYSDAEQVKAAVGERIRIHTENLIRLHVKDVALLSDARMYELVSRFAADTDQTVRDKLGLIIDIIDVEQLSNKVGETFSRTTLSHIIEKIEQLQEAIRRTDRKIIEAIISDDDENSYEVKLLEKKKEQLTKLLKDENLSAFMLSNNSGGEKFDKMLDNKSNNISSQISATDTAPTDETEDVEKI
ncbi:hypothetical protein [Mucilaginibacter rubeus]|uniref:Uncharacterized protein n=1 Tax=Mucilaginibacter rubeus TaxID=2027860 RepID=A0A5C1HTB1_9SPHI|nr:hypothetical protein [Mucilaginibacter rubeus]QEM09044.1 hypothetical protein DEO27_003100 [Mucilaginibacter rubeus]